MAQLGRPGLSAAQKATVWEQWKEGSHSAISAGIWASMLGRFTVSSPVMGESFCAPGADLVGL
jgi:uncharacterized cupin superfamily protein